MKAEFIKIQEVIDPLLVLNESLDAQHQCTPYSYTDIESYAESVQRIHTLNESARAKQSAIVRANVSLIAIHLMLSIYEDHLDRSDFASLSTLAQNMKNEYTDILSAMQTFMNYQSSRERKIFNDILKTYNTHSSWISKIGSRLSDLLGLHFHDREVWDSTRTAIAEDYVVELFVNHYDFLTITRAVKYMSSLPDLILELYSSSTLNSIMHLSELASQSANIEQIDTIKKIFYRINHSESISVDEQDYIAEHLPTIIHSILNQLHQIQKHRMFFDDSLNKRLDRSIIFANLLCQDLKANNYRIDNVNLKSITAQYMRNKKIMKEIRGRTKHQTTEVMKAYERAINNLSNNVRDLRTKISNICVVPIVDIHTSLRLNFCESPYCQRTIENKRRLYTDIISTQIQTIFSTIFVQNQDQVFNRTASNLCTILLSKNSFNTRL